MGTTSFLGKLFTSDPVSLEDWHTLAIDVDFAQNHSAQLPRRKRVPGFDVKLQPQALHIGIGDAGEQFDFIAIQLAVSGRTDYRDQCSIEIVLLT